MHRLSKERKQYLVSKQKRNKKKEIRSANRKKHLFYISRKDRIVREIVKQRSELRKEKIKQVYKKQPYKDKPQTVEIEGEFGIEEFDGIERYLCFASEFVDTESRRLTLDFQKCTRIWPSGITLLCSLSQWIGITAQPTNPPSVLSTQSGSDSVNSYLSHCGFYDYVGRKKEDTKTVYDDKRIVKISHETIDDDTEKQMEKREDEIVSLLEEYSVLTKEEIEEFNDIVLTEILINVHEHGMPVRDKGWWLMAQYHENHKIISLCIADNGIGFRNSLITGPQSTHIIQQVGRSEENDGKLIRYAFRENVSGALTASIREGQFLKLYERGARKGNGLERILSTCRKIGIQLSVLSHHGYLIFDENGNEKLVGSNLARIFAGTMYHLNIRAS